MSRSDRLRCLITDSWVWPKLLLGRMANQRFATANPSLGGSAIGSRFHPDLSEARVTAFNSSLVWFELLTRVRRLRGWERVIARNTHEEPDYALQCVAASYRVLFTPIVTIHHNFSGEVRSEMRNHLATRAMNYGVRCSDVLFHLLSEWLRGVFFPVPLCGQARVVVDSLRTFVVVAEISGDSVLSGKRRAVSWAGYAGFDCRKTNCWLVSDLGAWA
jgi:hypothetical protein